jgi:hypothetical protein
MVGYLADRRLLMMKGSPALNKDFFGTEENYTNIDKGRPSRDNMSAGFRDVLPLLNGNCTFQTMDGQTHTQSGRWDLVVAFPPCTKTTNAGARHLWAGGKLNIPRFYDGLCGKALFMAIRSADCDKIAIENPTPSAVFEYPKPSQAIQPFEYGHPATKRTCLWLKGLQPLQPTNIVEPEVIRTKNGKTFAPWHYNTLSLPPKERARERSKTFPGIAKAMAAQWGGVSK